MKQRHSNVVPECFADTVLMEILGFSYPNHSPLNNVSFVLKTIKQARPHAKVVGIIDNDRGRSEKMIKQDKLLQQFKLVDDQRGIKKYTYGNHTILLLYPAFENWIFENAASEEANVDPAKHGFSAQKDFMKACKDVEATNNPRLKQFLNTLKQKNAPGFVQLKSWICEGAGIDEKDM